MSWSMLGLLEHPRLFNLLHHLLLLFFDSVNQFSKSNTPLALAFQHLFQGRLRNGQIEPMQET